MASLTNFVRTIKQGPDRVRRQVALHNAVRIFKSTIRSGRTPGIELFNDLIFGWGNEAWAPDPTFLSVMVREALTARGPILECGTGLSTILLGIISMHTGNSNWSLEHDENWHKFVLRQLSRFKIPGLAVRHAPLKSFGDYMWYAADGLELPASFALVICDGPPGYTRGGRYGLLPVMQNKLLSGARIILDDAQRPDEVDIMNRWQREATPGLKILSTTDRYALLEVG